MAPISDDLAASLDALREQIKEAESYLVSHPHGDDLTVQLDSAEKMRVEIGLMVCGGKARLCMETTDDANEDNNHLAPIVDLPVAKRVRCAKSIPKLIEKCDKMLESFPEDVAELADDISEAIARSKNRQWPSDL
ncbi:MAG: hypothetical protein AAF802_14715 [Planctomycetota bacterium]